MCRFVLYQGPPITIASLVTEPAHSIINQSVHAAEAEEPLNGDGFGIAWYVPDLSPRPGLFRSVTPAWSNQNLLDLARVTRSGLVLAHVRAATRGLPVAEINCHPFTSGPFAFMHNGDVARFQQVRRQLLADLADPAFSAIRGSTDSEHLFAVFLDEAGEGFAGSPDRGGDLGRALERAIARVMALCARVRGILPAPDPTDDDSWINCAVTDGVCSAACRFTTSPEEPSSLYVHTGRRYVCEEGVCRMVDPERGHDAVVVASEPLSDDPGWAKVPRNHLVIVREDRSVGARPLAA
jgi:glutamine amidotransferase